MGSRWNSKFKEARIKMKKYLLPEPPKGPNKETYYKWAKDVGKYMNQYFPHDDLSSPKKLYEFICTILPFVEMKKNGKIKTLKDGSGVFDLKKYREKKNEILRKAYGGRNTDE